MSKIAFIRKQSFETWGQLHRRIHQLDPILCEALLPPQTAAYIKKQATALCSSEGFLYTSMLAATAYLVGETSWFQKPVGESKKRPNIYAILIGPPGTGKSQSINAGATEPLMKIAEQRSEKENIIISRSTSAGLLKQIASSEKAMLVSGEIYDILFKLIKCDNETGTGDTTLLCELFSGEVSSMSYATQHQKTVKANTPFCILGASQPRPAFELLSMMADKSNGLHHRFLFFAPQCYRPSYTDIATALEDMKDLPTINEIMKAIESSHSEETTYMFSQESKVWLRSLHDDHARELNDSIREGKPTSESKIVDHIERVAVSLHVLGTIAERLLTNEQPNVDTHIIPQETVQAAAKFVEHCEAQKEIIMQELGEILKPIIASCKEQPKADDLKMAILLFPGKAITYRAFRQSGPRRFRSAIKKEFESCIQNLDTYGTYVEVKVCTKMSVFVKRSPDTIPWGDNAIVKEEDYVQAYSQKLHSAVTRNVCDALEQRGIATVQFLTSDN